MYKIIFLILFSLALNAKMVDGVAILVQDDPITTMDIKKMMHDSHLDQSKSIDILIRKKLQEQEIRSRKIEVSNDEVIDEIKNMARQNNMNVNQFYEAVANSENLTSSEIQKKIKERLVNEKLFQSIAFSHMEEPDEQEIKDYYELNKAKFNHPQSFTTIVYESKRKDLLQEKIDNPMFYSPEISHRDQTLEYKKISPQLAEMLEKTPVNGFSAVIPNGKDGYLSFYVQSVAKNKETPLEDIKAQVTNMIMNDKREQVLKEYFDRARLNANIQTIRMPE
ncbi:peptidylprolyl isomerase [Sulfurimonas sp. HSL-1716]|uniref:peptidylprolyl isomerase n=1 Tax=Hydrocurvibacter sulfurireducens TaxID=3131937 RepID=UPI0031F9C1D1